MRHLKQQKKDSKMPLKKSYYVLLPDGKEIILIQVSEIMECSQLKHISEFIYLLYAGLIC